MYLVSLINTIKKELLLYYRLQSECLISVLFFIIIAVLFPLTLNVTSQKLALLAPGVIWVAALLAILLSLPQLFRDDVNDGSLAQHVLAPMPLPLLILGKVIAHWMVFSVPLILISPLLALLFQLSLKATGFLVLSLILGTPILHLLGGFVAALTTGLRQSNMLLALVLIPLTVPTLIFSCGLAASGSLANAVVPLLLLAAILVFALTLIPFVAASALKVSVNYEH